MKMNPLLPFWPLLVSLILFTGFFVRQELRRPLKFRAWRVFAVILMMVAVCGIFLRPSYTSIENSNILLLTPGYDQSLADSLQRANPEATFFRIAGAPHYQEAKEMSTIRELSMPMKHLKAVVGVGIPLSAVNEVGYPFEFYPSHVTTGFTSIKIPKNAERNVKSIIHGIYRSDRSSGKLYLEGPSGKIDSVSVSKGTNPFKLEFTPRAIGNTLYTISTSGKTKMEPVPVHIERRAPLNILFLQEYPTFEVQYLKNFLADKGNQLAVRYQLSKNIFRYEYANRKPISIDRISPLTLNEFDLVILDNGVISKLSGSERQMLNTAMRKGLGVLTLVQTQADVPVKNPFLPFGLRKEGHDTTTIKLERATYTLPAAMLRPSPDADLTFITKNKSGTLSGYAYSGRGKAGVQLLQETYRIILSGDSINYGNLWSPLIDGVSRSRTERSTISIESDIPLYSDEPINVNVSSTAPIPKIYADSIRIPLIEDEAVDGIWHTKLWAGREGWHQLTCDGDTLNYFVFNEADWYDLRVTSTVNANLIASKMNKATDGTSSVATKAFPPIYLYGLFLLSAGFLWLAPKL